MKQASKDTRERAIAAYKKGISIKNICQTYGIGRKTFYLWRKRDAEGGTQTPKPKGHPPRYLTTADMEKIKNLVDSCNSITAKEICEKLGFTCHPTVIYRALKKLNYTKKTLKASEQNRGDVEKQRQEWREWQKECPAQRIICLDESAIKTNLVPRNGWSIKGKRCYDSAPASWRTYSILSAIGHDCIIDSILIDGPLNKPTFKYFMEDILLSQLHSGDIVVLDNLSVHKNSFDIKLFKRKGVEIKYLPLYSPDLNPIEPFWNQFKSYIRKLRPRNFDEIWNAMNEALWKVTSENLLGYYDTSGYFH